MNTKIAGFDWDSGNWPKCGKHGLSKEEIELVFQSEFAVMPDPHPDEPRMRAIGQIPSGRWIFVVFMLREIRGKVMIRPISARHMHQREVDHYATYANN
jgi:uncharacterized DUF497 family protein